MFSELVVIQNTLLPFLNIGEQAVFGAVSHQAKAMIEGDKNNFFNRKDVVEQRGLLKQNIEQRISLKKESSAFLVQKKGIQERLAKSRTTWKGWIASVIIDPNSHYILSKIISVVCCIFSAVKKEVNLQRNLLNSLEGMRYNPHKDEIDECNGRIVSCKQTLKRFKNEEVIKRLKVQAEKKMTVDLFGKERYEKLPVLKFKKRMQTKATGYIDRIYPDDMSHHLMKGVDHFGRKFFSIKMLSWNGEAVCQTFFERYANTYDWSDAGVGIVRVFGYMIQQTEKPMGFKVNERAYSKLKGVIDGIFEGNLHLEDDSSSSEEE